jgi:hypothetical protein
MSPSCASITKKKRIPEEFRRGPDKRTEEERGRHACASITKKKRIPEEFRRGPDKRTEEERGRHANARNPRKARKKYMCKTELCPSGGQRGCFKGFCKTCAKQKGYMQPLKPRNTSHHKKKCVKKSKREKFKQSATLGTVGENENDDPVSEEDDAEDDDVKEEDDEDDDVQKEEEVEFDEDECEKHGLAAAALGSVNKPGVQAKMKVKKEPNDDAEKKKGVKKKVKVKKEPKVMKEANDNYASVRRKKMKGNEEKMEDGEDAWKNGQGKTKSQVE